MFLAAAKTLAAMVGEQELEVGALYPSLTQIRDISAAIAAAVWETAWSEGNAAQKVPNNPIQFLKEKMYFPDYPTYQPA
jgi:malate dehydrogenase (oxaloacetate-decarboxylating)(NADP+)